MYETYYGLKGKPFQISPDARFFFKSKCHNRAMAYLRYGLKQREGFIVITGDVGTGKTMLVRTLFDDLAEEDVIAAQIASTQLDADNVVRMVCAAFGLVQEGRTKADLLQNLEQFLQEQHRAGKRLLLVIDEAQNLPAESIEELRMLSNFHANSEAILQSFLLGQSELKQTLRAPGMEQVRQRILAAYHLEALGVEDTKAYVMHRLGQVGWTRRPGITDDAFAELHAFTRGVPRRINTVTDRVLLFASLEELSLIDGQHIRVVVDELKGEISHADEQPLPVALSANHHPPEGLEARVAALEAEMAELRRTVRKDRQILKKTILMQMDFDDDGPHE